MTTRASKGWQNSNGNVDPTKNVLSLVDAAVTRLNDLNEAEARRVNDLRAAEQLRVDQLRVAESRRIDEQLVLRSDYEEQLRSAEAKRIDAIRAVDVNAVAVERQRSSDQASVLASQVAGSAETLRALVATTNTAISARITTLEQAQYKGEGKQAVADPTLAEFIVEVKRYMTAAERSTGKGEGFSTSWAILLGAIAGLFGLISIGAIIFATLHQQPVQQPVYVQPPAVSSTIK